MQTDEDIARKETNFFRETSFFVFMKPKPKGRPRLTRSGHAYTPKETVKAEKTIATIAKLEYKSAPSEKPIRLHLKFFFLIPKSWTKKKKKYVMEELNGAHTSTPDLDNLAKLCKDALQGVIFKNDSAVACMVCEKSYNDQIEGVEITVTEL